MKPSERISEIAGVSRLETSGLLAAVVAYLDEAEERRHPIARAHPGPLDARPPIIDLTAHPAPDDMCRHEPGRCKEWCPVGAKEELESTEPARPAPASPPSVEVMALRLERERDTLRARVEELEQWGSRRNEIWNGRYKQIRVQHDETRRRLEEEVNRLNAEAFELKRKLEALADAARETIAYCNKHDYSQPDTQPLELALSA